MPVAVRLLAIMLLRAGPQHLPYSVSLLAVLTGLYAASGVLVLVTSMSIGQAAANLVLDVAVLYAFSYFCLSLLRYTARFVQMVSALTGIGAVYHVLAWPLFTQLMQPQQHDVTIIALLMLLLISWQVLVFAHIFRYTMQMSMLRALVLSFGYLFLSIAAAEIIFPGS